MITKGPHRVGSHSSLSRMNAARIRRNTTQGPVDTFRLGPHARRAFAAPSFRASSPGEGGDPQSRGALSYINPFNWPGLVFRNIHQPLYDVGSRDPRIGVLGLVNAGLLLDMATVRWVTAPVVAWAASGTAPLLVTLAIASLGLALTGSFIRYLIAGERGRPVGPDARDEILVDLRGDIVVRGEDWQRVRQEADWHGERWTLHNVLFKYFSFSRKATALTLFFLNAALLSSLKAGNAVGDWLNAHIFVGDLPSVKYLALASVNFPLFRALFGVVRAAYDGLAHLARNRDTRKHAAVVLGALAFAAIETSTGLFFGGNAILGLPYKIGYVINAFLWLYQLPILQGFGGIRDAWTRRTNRIDVTRFNPFRFFKYIPERWGMIIGSPLGIHWGKVYGHSLLSALPFLQQSDYSKALHTAVESTGYGPTAYWLYLLMGPAIMLGLFSRDRHFYDTFWQRSWWRTLRLFARQGALEAALSIGGAAGVLVPLGVAGLSQQANFYGWNFREFLLNFPLTQPSTGWHVVVPTVILSLAIPLLWGGLEGFKKGDLIDFDRLTRGLRRIFNPGSWGQGGGNFVPPPAFNDVPTAGDTGVVTFTNGPDPEQP